MSYTINLSNGTSLIPGGLPDGTVNTTASSLTLVGRDYAGYGQFINENFVYLLENFANGTGPANPLRGQLWWDTANNILRVWSGASWKISTGATASPFSSPPSDLSALGGDLWFDTTNSQLKVYSGSSWIVVGPVATPATGNTGAVPAIMQDTGGSNHIVIQFLISSTIYAIFSKDTFSSSLTGFTTIVAGLNFSSVAAPSMGISTQSAAAVPNTLVVRDGAAGITVGGITGTSLTASVITATSSLSAPTFTGNISGNVAAGLVQATTVSASTLSATSGITGTLSTASQPFVTSVGTLNGLQVGTSGSPAVTNIYGSAFLNGVGIATLGGSASFSSINNTPIGNTTPSTGAFTTLTVTGNLVPQGNLVNNIGTSSNWFNNIYGRAVQALYADLAERFAADAEYEPGTVVELGGTAEVTKVVEELSETVFGVISTNAAYLMNSNAGNDATHPPIAVSGRVPVRAVGFINKGDRLVSAGNGLARSGSKSEITPWNVIGRSLVDKTTEGVGIIEAIVKINN